MAHSLGCKQEIPISSRLAQLLRIIGVVIVIIQLQLRCKPSEGWAGSE